MTAFQGKPPGSGAGEMSRCTERLRPIIALTAKEVAAARRSRRAQAAPEQIAAALGAVVEEVGKALVQLRSLRPETTRGTLNATLAAQQVFLGERIEMSRSGKRLPPSPASCCNCGKKRPPARPTNVVKVSGRPGQARYPLF